MSQQTLRLSSLFTPEQVITNVRETREGQIICQLVERIALTGEIQDVEATCRAVLERDRCGLAHLDSTIAVFHARVAGLSQVRIALAARPDGLECCDVRSPLFVLVLAPPDEPSAYLRVVASLERICRIQGCVERITALKDAREVWEAFRQADDRLPDYVTARDMMRTSFRWLRDTDTLSDAIDTFCRTGLSEIPVLDRDGDLVGVVSEDELIRVCLPEYVTWMEDLSPIIDFQPFAEILRREHQMPVVEITLRADRYATVDEATPAIQVAKIMMRRDVRQVLVLRDRSLVGVIAIQDFIRKVLRA